MRACPWKNSKLPGNRPCNGNRGDTVLGVPSVSRKVLSVSVRAIVLTGFGISCDNETQSVLSRAGAAADRIHLNDLIDDATRLDAYHLFALPGGFSFGDDVASGKILANRLRSRLGGALHKWIDDGKLVIAIGQGFLTLLHMGVLPFFDKSFARTATLAPNDSGRFENRWVHLKTEPGTRCVWLNDLESLPLPVRHSGGKFVPQDDDVLRRLYAAGQVALRYVQPDGSPAAGAFPWNPSGAIDDIAGICDPTGRVFGLIPHPEAFVDRTNHPTWTRSSLPDEGAGLQIFRNAVEYARANLV